MKGKSKDIWYSDIWFSRFELVQFLLGLLIFIQGVKAVMPAGKYKIETAVVEVEEAFQD